MTRPVLALPALLTAVLTATLTGGCTAPAASPPGPATPGSTTPGSTTPGSTTPGSTTPEPGTPEPTAGSPSSSLDGSLGPVVARRSAALDGIPAQVQLYRLVRDGSLVQLTFGLTSTAGITLDRQFSDPGSADYEADGITLIDGARRKVYLVASHGDGECLCTSLSGLRVSASPTLISATFAAPPAGTPFLDVSIPRFGVFSDVPVR